MLERLSGLTSLHESLEIRTHRGGDVLAELGMHHELAAG
jgi:hypothetical protein